MVKNGLMAAFLWGMILALSCQAHAVTQDEETKIAAAMPDKPIVAPARPRTVLVFSRCDGFKHSSIPYWIKALEIMSAKTGAFKADFSDDMAVFTEQNDRFVYVKKNDTEFEKRSVQIGLSDYFHAEVVSGLQEGEIVSLEVPPGETLGGPDKGLAGVNGKAGGASSGKGKDGKAGADKRGATGSGGLARTNGVGSGAVRSGS